MIKVRLVSDKEYFSYCAVEGIGSIHRKYGSQSCYIDGGVWCDHWEDISGESMHIITKPVNYPCVLAWYCEEGDHDNYHGMFVYPEDF